MREQGVVSTLRNIVPIRPLTREEALRIAERQSLMLLRAASITEPAVPDTLISELPRVRVERLTPLPISGAAHWTQGQWLVVLNASEPAVRQRFSLAHEFKHILDHRFIGLLYNGVLEADRQAWIEQVCDYFAGCLLVPRPWLKRAWTSGTQDTGSLATLFGVSRAAMNVRLNQVGLTGPQARCAAGTVDWTDVIVRVTSDGYRRERSHLRPRLGVAP